MAKHSDTPTLTYICIGMGIMKDQIIIRLKGSIPGYLTS